MKELNYFWIVARCDPYGPCMIAERDGSGWEVCGVMCPLTESEMDQQYIVLDKIEPPARPLLRPTKPCPFCGCIALDVDAELSDEAPAVERLGWAHVTCTACLTEGPHEPINNIDDGRMVEVARRLATERWDKRADG